MLPHSEEAFTASTWLWQMSQTFFLLDGAPEEVVPEIQVQFL